MNISPQDVKKLRDETGAGFGDCKKALEIVGGDFELAKKKLREMGIASAEKRSGRDAKEGRVFVYSGKSRAGILLMSCETDFVAMNENFVSFGSSLLHKIVEDGQNKLNETQELDVKTLAATTKENVQIGELFILNIAGNELVEGYTHGEQAKIGVLLKLKSEDSSKLCNENLVALAKDLTLHIAAFSPYYLGNWDVGEEYIKEQEEIFSKQLEASGKPKNIIEGIIAGKVKKHLAEICLLDQGFVKDDKLTVRQKLEEVSKLIGSKVEITQFKYLAIDK